jgi:hypothetical protein
VNDVFVEWQTRHSHTTLAIFVPIFILLWAYLMKVIPQTRYSHYIIYVCFYFYFTMSVPDEDVCGITFIRYVLSRIKIETNISNVVWMTCLWNDLHQVPMSVPDEGYSTNTSFAYYISYLRSYFYFTMSVPDEGYSRNTPFTLH